MSILDKLLHRTPAMPLVSVIIASYIHARLCCTKPVR